MPTTAGIHYIETGQEHTHIPPIILLHGAGCSHLCWPPELRKIKGFRILALDLPGHGRSSGSAQQTISAYTEYLSRFMQEKNIYKVFLCGYSMGGGVALQFALQQPRRTIGLGLISSGAFLGGQNEICTYLSTKATHPNALQMIEQKSFSTDANPVLIRRSMQNLQKIRQSVLYCDWRACNNFDIRPQVKRIRKPTWIICGSADQLTPPAFSHFLHKSMKNSTLEVVPKQGHSLIQENPKLIQKSLLEFISGLPQFNKNEK